MKFVYVAIGAAVAIIPAASFTLIALEVIMIYQIAKSHGSVPVFDLIWFCTKIGVVSVFLKLLASTMHVIPVIGQFANSLVAAGFIYFVYDLADSHYSSLSSK